MEKSSLDELAERLEEEQHAKRYLGSLARAGELRAARDQEEKREDLEGLVHDLANAEELRRSRLDALRDDLSIDEEIPEDKRSSMAALARAGALPKRVLDDDEEMLSDELNDDKRGISSIARNGYFQKRIGDDDLEQLMSEVYGIGEKRNVASMARGFQLPQNGKRNIASIVRDRSKKDSYEDNMEEDKRNLPSIIRDRSENTDQGKRHIGAFVANHGIPFVNNDKRNLGALARNRGYPFVSKRDTSEDEIDKRYVASLLRQGRIPAGEGAVAPDHDDVGLKGNAPEDTKSDISGITKDDSNHSRSKRAATGPAMEKRYFGVRGGGKMPGGRLPKVGSRSRNRHENSGRRRH
ncbi:hypothetical protein GE061_011652 [Apolygus lucorum]|uniref:Neuropeptide-like 1 n=1 Tax=Apolygus lucorum TaxID=248454 RepID=A0A6A4JS88_APOLU|nr:hypothetical protein GE061_011652 [Apolygus lucorum]